MPPRRPHLRNRKRIKAPKRFEDEYDLTSPRKQDSSHEEGKEESKEESSDLEEELYKSPKPKTPKKPKQPAYSGKVIEFNPNLPPAAFPTLDHPTYVHNGGTVYIDLDLHVPRSKYESINAGYESINAINPASSGHNSHSEEIDPTDDLPTLISTTTDFTHPEPLPVMQRSHTGQRQARGSMLSSDMWGEPTDNGPRNPIWLRNMARIEKISKMSNLDRIQLEMETSDEEEEDAAAAGRPTKFAKKKATGPPKFPVWDDLTIAHKLDLADTIAEVHPDPAQVMHQLRLTPTQKESLVELLIQRQDRAARQVENMKRLTEQTQKMFLRGEQVSQSTFRQMVEENLYGEIHEDDHCQTNMMELKKARAYMQFCGFDPALADESWEVPSISDTESAQGEPEASRPDTNAQTPAGASGNPISRQPGLSTPSQEFPHLPDHPSELLQQQHNSQGTQSQHRHPPPAHSLIAQHSPAAPLSKVPSQSFRVTAPDGNGNGNHNQSSGSDNNPRAVHQGTKRAAHQSNSLSAWAVQPNYGTTFLKSADTASLPKKKKGKASLSPFLPLPPNHNNNKNKNNQQGEESSSSTHAHAHAHVQIESHALAPKSKGIGEDKGGLAMTQQANSQHDYHHHQSSGAELNHHNAGVSSGPEGGNGGVVVEEGGDAANDKNNNLYIKNKKKRKRGGVS